MVTGLLLLLLEPLLRNYMCSPAADSAAAAAAAGAHWNTAAPAPAGPPFARWVLEFPAARRLPAAAAAYAGRPTPVAVPAAAAVAAAAAAVWQRQAAGGVLLT